MVPIYICEDHQENREYLTKMIENYILIYGYDMKVVLSTADPEEVLAHRQTHAQRSIYFFDVDLQHAVYDGFSLAKAIRTLDTRGFLIFVTTHEELIFETFKYRLEAMSYLFKEDRQQLGEQIQACLLEIQQLLAQVDDPESYYTVKAGDVKHQLPLADILFFETAAAQHRIILHSQQRVLEFRGNLKTVEEQVGDAFLKIHRSFLVNKAKIEQVNYADNTVIMQGGRVCLMSRKGRKLLRAYYGEG